MSIALVCAVVLALFGLGAQSALAGSSPIEGVWSFNGGEVSIEAGPGGTFIGRVVAKTTFAECSHPVGQEMWTGIRQQPDGSFWGLHQWYYQESNCEINQHLGLTAWRVSQAQGGARRLEVCFSQPGGSQPTISASGVAGGNPYECVYSTLLAPTPVSGQEAFREAVTLPGTHRCYSRRSFQIHLRDPKHDPLKEVLVRLAGHDVRVVRHGGVFAATVNLRGLPKGAFTVRIRVTTVLGRHLSGHRTYHTCARKTPRASRSASQG
jgi:hypothetical protein